MKPCTRCGLLCNSCNIAIGLLRHDPRILETAAGYLMPRSWEQMVEALADWGAI